MWSPLNLVAIAGLLGSSAQAWHLQIHNQIAFIAEKMLTPRALNVTSSLLDSKYQGSIGRAAAWADTVRKDKNGATFSYNWHFVSMTESINATHPPATCQNGWYGVCGNGDCVVAQIANQTSILKSCVERLANKTYVEDVNCQQALMWVVHFVGDVGQPLHSSGTYYGGNIVRVLFNGTSVNLHESWDRLILYLEASHPFDFSHEHLDDYFETLLARIHNDDFDVPRKDWLGLGCTGASAGKDDSCARRWAEDSHKAVCNSVYTMPLNNTVDLVKTGYAKRVFPVIELQLAKSAWRLAAWLNGVVEAVDAEQGDRDSSATPIDVGAVRAGEQQQQILV